VQVLVHNCSADDIMNFTPEAGNEEASSSSTVSQVKITAPSKEENDRENGYVVESQSRTIQDPAPSNSSTPMVARHPFGREIVNNDALVRPHEISSLIYFSSK